MNEHIPSGPHFYTDAVAGQHHAYILPALLKALSRQEGSRVFEIGSGSGYIANELQKAGYEVTGVEPSSEGVGIGPKRSQSESGAEFTNVANRRLIAARFETLSR